MDDTETQKIRDDASDAARAIVKVAMDVDFETYGQPSERAMPAFCASVLNAAGEQLHAQADRITEARKRGHQSTSASIRDAAARVIGLAQQCAALADATETEVARASSIRVIDGGDVPDGPLIPIPGPNEDYEVVSSDTSAADHVRAYLAGETDRIPDMSPVAVVDTHHCPGCGSGTPPGPLACEACTAAYGADAVDPFTDPAAVVAEAEGITMQAASAPVHELIKSEAAKLADPFTDPVGPRRVGPVVTFAQLSTPPTNPAPEHRSHSQLTTYTDCGLKYRLQRRDNVLEVPQWSLIGGNAFHKAVEHFEAANAMYGSVAAPGDAGQLWQEYFTAEIAATAAASPVPFAEWRASVGGKEGYDFWRVEGEDMVRRYIDQRVKLAETAGAQAKRIARWSNQPMIEFETAWRVPSMPRPIKVILDQVWELPAEPGTVHIVDLKSGKTVPSDTTQLGEQAHALTQLPGFTGKKIIGSFYDARKGTYTEPVDLLARHPLAVADYQYAAFDRAESAGVYVARPSSYCGGCSVAYACPVRQGSAS